MEEKFENNKIKVYPTFDKTEKSLKKLDYTINAISGIYGLEPTLKIIKHTKKIAIANKDLSYVVGI